MEAVRRFVSEMPAEGGLALAGRAYFFDSETERVNALGVNGEFITLNLSDFTDEQVQNYFAAQGIQAHVPSWLPTRPLLLGTIVARGFLRDLMQNPEKDVYESIDPATGWDMLIEQIARREARIEVGIDAFTLRRIFERLATKARNTASGLGPLTTDQIFDAFREICGYPPDEQGITLLQRLPGLGVDQENEATRKFIDEDFADVCRAGDVIDYVTHPYDFDRAVFTDIDTAIRFLGISIAANRLKQLGMTIGGLTPALRKATEIYDEGTALAADLVRIAMENGWDIKSPIYVRNVLIPEIEITARVGDMALVEFQDCYFTYLGMDSDLAIEKLPKFRQCYFSEIDGCTSSESLPKGVFLTGCEFDRFVQNVETTKAILSLDLPIGTRVLLTLLRKLFIQPGAGRRESALYRGLDHRERRLIPDLLRLLQSEGFISHCSFAKSSVKAR